MNTGVLGIFGIGLIWLVLQIAAFWKLFVKAGEPGWKSVIPVYSTYTMYKIAWQPKFFWITVLLPVATGVLTAITSGSDAGLMMSGMISGFVGIAMIVLGILFCMKLAQAFGKGGLFVLGLWFLQPIFLMILAFGKSEYQGSDF